MHALVLALALLPAGAQPDRFDVQVQLQGLYDESSQAMLQFATELDVDEFHDTLYSNDWVFVDTTGQKHTWQQTRAQAVQALGAEPPDSIVQTIRRLSFDADGVTVVVDSTTITSAVDAEGHHGPAGASHTLTTTTRFRDRWVQSGGGWKQVSREQLDAPRTVVDLPLSST